MTDAVIEGGLSYTRQYTRSKSRVPRAALPPVKNALLQVLQNSLVIFHGSKLPVPHGYVLTPVNSLEGATTIVI